jgi:hypothetical protein
MELPHSQGHVASSDCASIVEGLSELRFIVLLRTSSSTAELGCMLTTSFDIEHETGGCRQSHESGTRDFPQEFHQNAEHAFEKAKSDPARKIESLACVKGVFASMNLRRGIRVRTRRHGKKKKRRKKTKSVLYILLIAI